MCPGASPAALQQRAPGPSLSQVQWKKFSSSADILCSVFVVWHGSKYLSCQVSSTTRVERNISVLSPKCSSNCQLLRNVSLMREEDILPFVTTWMDLEYIVWSERSQAERQGLCDITCMWNLKKPKLKKKKNLSKGSSLVV